MNSVDTHRLALAPLAHAPEIDRADLAKRERDRVAEATAIGDVPQLRAPGARPSAMAAPPDPRDPNDHQQLLEQLQQLLQLLGESAEHELSSQAGLIRSLTRTLSDAIACKARDYAEAQRKADLIQRIVSGISQGLGWVLGAVGIVLALPSGGAALGLALGGFALINADIVLKTLTDFSVLEAVLRPLNDALIAPLTSAIMNGFTRLLVAAGVDPGVATAVAAALTLAALCALCVAGHQLAVRLSASPLLREALGAAADWLQRRLPAWIPATGAWLGQAGGQLVQGLRAAVLELLRLPDTSTALRTALQQLELLISGVLLPGVQSAGSVFVGAGNKQAADARADARQEQQSLLLLRGLDQQLAQDLGDHNAAAQRVLAEIDRVLREQDQTHHALLAGL